MELIDRNFPYLHSTSETFLNYASKVDIGGYNNETSIKEMDLIIQELQKKISIMKNRENNFYQSFRNKDGKVIKTPEEWSNNFLIRDNKQISLNQAVLEIFQSKDMFSRLKNLSTILSGEDLINNISGKISKEFEKDLLKELKKLPLEEAVSKALAKTLSRERGKQNKKISDKEIFDTLLHDVVPDIKNIVTTTGQAKNLGKNGKYGKSIQQATKALTKKNSTFDAVNNVIKSTLREKLVDYGYSQEVDSILRIWDVLVKQKKVLNNENFYKIDLSVFFDGDSSHISGGVQEIGSVFSIALIADTNLSKGVDIKDVYSYGAQLVERYDTKNKVQSKTDTVIELSKNKKIQSYRIQEKNSISDIYNSLDSLSWTKQTDQTFAKMTIQRESSLEHYFNLAQALSKGGHAFLKEQDIAALSYLLVNYLTLSSPSYTRPSWAKGREGRADIRKTINLNTRAIIERLMSLNTISYFSDIPKDIEKSMQIETVDFIIFKSRILIPMSYIYEDIIEYLKNDYKMYKIGASKMGKNTQLQTSFNFKYSTALVKNMNKAKEKKGINAALHYSQDDFTAIGKYYGNKTVKNISMRSVQLEIDPRQFHNLLSQTFHY